MIVYYGELNYGIISNLDPDVVKNNVPGFTFETRA